jgi:hypothetical protein
MRHLETDQLTSQDVSSTLLCSTYTADRERLIFVRLFVDGISGGGDYTAYLTVQRGGTGSEYYIVPLTVTNVGAGQTAILLTTIAIPVNDEDVVRVYLQGRPADTSVNIFNEVWEDDSNFYTTPPGFFPSGSLGYALGQIGSGSTIRIQVPIMDNNKLELVRGDDYDADHGSGITLSSEQWPDLTDAEVAFVTEQLTVNAVVLGAQQVLVELTAAQTTSLSSGYFSLVATFTDGDVISLIPKARLLVKTRVSPSA